MSLDTYGHVVTEGRGGRDVVLFHGTGSSKEDILGLLEHISPDARALAMDGDVLEGRMRRFFRRAAEGVYDMEDLQARTAAMAAFLDAAVAEYGLRDPVGIGYSNGANILANLVLTGRGPIRASALLHPLIPFEPDWPDLAGHRILVTAGKRDPICPWPLTETLVDGLTRAGAAVSLTAHEGGHELRMEEVEAARAFIAD